MGENGIRCLSRRQLIYKSYLIILIDYKVKKKREIKEKITSKKYEIKKIYLRQ